MSCMTGNAIFGFDPWSGDWEFEYRSISQLVYYTTPTMHVPQSEKMWTVDIAHPRENTTALALPEW